jgi:hypothetical protein
MDSKNLLFLVFQKVQRTTKFHEKIKKDPMVVRWLFDHCFKMRSPVKYNKPSTYLIFDNYNYVSKPKI